MEPPPPSLSSTAVASTVVPTTTVPVPPPPTTSSYPESQDSSPRSRTTDGWDDLHPPSSAVSSKLRLMCSYGGHILPRPHDKSLCYMGGDTRIVVVDRSSSLSSLVARLSGKLLDGRSFTLKYQLPSEDLDSLISVTTDEDLENMIEEYDRTVSGAPNSAKPSRLRLFLFTPKPEATQSMGQILESSAKSEDWFLNALNSAGLLNRGFSDSDANVNRLLGLDDGLRGDNNGENLDSSVKDDDGSVKSGKQQQIQDPPPQPQQQQGGGQDVHSMPDSPMLDTSSSFGSTSSSPLPANLPPIRVHVEEAGGGVKGVQDQRMGIEEQFARFNVGNNNKQQQQVHQQQEDGFAGISSPPPPLPVTISLPAAPANASAGAVSSEFQTRVFSDDERSDHGVPAGYRKPPTPRSQPQNLPPQQVHHVKSNSGGHELPSPHSVSSDSSMNNPVFQQRPSVYQEQPMSQMPSGSTVVTGMINPSDPNTLLPMQSQDPGYILHPQFEQQSAPSQPQQQQQQQQQQYIHAAGPQFIHHHPSGGLPMQYIQVYPSQPQQQSFHRHPGQLDQQQPYPAVFYVTSPVPPRPYGMGVPQSGSVSEAPGSVPSNHPQAPPLNSSTMMAPPPPPNSQLRSVPGGKPEAGVYATPQGMPGAQMVHQIPTSQQQFMGYPQMHHPPQSGSAAISSYGYDYADNAHKQMFYTQPVGHAQYQTMTGPPPAMVLPDGSAAAAKLPAENMTQQIRSSQPL